MQSFRLDIGERQLASGLTLLAARNGGVQTYAAGLVLDVDMRDEVPGEEGLASFVGETLDEGTQKQGGVALAEALDDLGSALSGNSAGGTVSCPARHSAASLELLREMACEPSFPEKEVSRVRDEVLQDIRIEEEDPRQVALNRFRLEVYKDHPFGRPMYGSAERVASFDADRLRGFHSHWFVPHDGFVAAAGPGSVEGMLDELEGVFGSMTGPTPAHVRPERPSWTDPGIDVHIPMEREQVHVFVGHLGVKRTHPDFYALSVMDHVLGTGPGFTSRISRRLRDEMGLCYSVHAAITLNAGEEPGTFSAYIGTSPEHREKAIAGFMDEIERIRSEPVSEKELSDVKEYLTGSYVFSFERNTQLARYAVRAKRFGLGFDHIREYPGLIRSVTREDVLRVAQEHLHPERMVRISAGAQ